MPYMKRVKFRLYPTKEQEKIMIQNCHNARFAYNWAAGRVKDALTNKETVPSAYDLSKEFCMFKKLPGNEWLSQKPASQRATKMAITNQFGSALRKFFSGKARQPSFKSKHTRKMSYYAHEGTTLYEPNRVRLENIGFVKCKNSLPVNDKDVKYAAPSILWDGIDFFMSVIIKYPDNPKFLYEYNDENDQHAPIGIDVGVVHQMVTSDGDIYDVPDVSRIEKRISRLDRKMHRQRIAYEKRMTQIAHEAKTKPIDRDSQVSNNYMKTAKRKFKLYDHSCNIRADARIKAVNDIFSKRPKSIVIENICDTKFWYIKNHDKYNHRVLNSCVKDVIHRIKTKCSELNVPLIIAKKYYPSSQICNSCGNRRGNQIGKNRVFKCCRCGYTEDRDLNAAKNLRDLAYA